MSLNLLGWMVGWLIGLSVGWLVGFLKKNGRNVDNAEDAEQFNSNKNSHTQYSG